MNEKHRIRIAYPDADTVELHCDGCPFHLTYLYSTAVRNGYPHSWDVFCGEAYGAAYELHEQDLHRNLYMAMWGLNTNEPAAVVTTPISDGDELRAVVEADMLLSSAWHDRRGCSCGRHLPQNVSTLSKTLEPDHETRLRGGTK